MLLFNLLSPRSSPLGIVRGETFMLLLVHLPLFRDNRKGAQLSSRPDPISL